MIKQNPSGSNLLRIAGGFVAVFSLVISLLILFVIPTACSFVGSIQLIILSFLFIGGVFSFLLGEILLRKKRKVTANPTNTPK